MTRKHFLALALAIRVLPGKVRAAIAFAVANVLAERYERFDFLRFLSACDVAHEATEVSA